MSRISPGMPCFYFHLRTANHAEQAERREFPDLREALIAANGAARSLIHKHVRRAPAPLHGSLDIQDERRLPVARIMLADVARQIS
jgi:hypothetical protein